MVAKKQLHVSYCSELCTIIGFKETKVSYFGSSVTKIYTTQEDYKPVLICVNCCQIPIYTAVMSNCIQFANHTYSVALDLQILNCQLEKKIDLNFETCIGYALNIVEGFKFDFFCCVFKGIQGQSTRFGLWVLI